MWAKVQSMDFYPRPPCGGRRLPTPGIPGRYRFLSTPSVWRATFTLETVKVVPSDFYPRPPCGGRLRRVLRSRINSSFLSTPSVWRATDGKVTIIHITDISIHALRVEGDRPEQSGQQPQRKISIHALRVEGDRTTAPSGAAGWNFYPRPPCGGRQAERDESRIRELISIHALRVEGDERAGAGPVTRQISIHALRVEGDWLPCST